MGADFGQSATASGRLSWFAALAPGMAPSSSTILAPASRGTQHGKSRATAAWYSSGVACGIAARRSKRLFCHHFQPDQPASIAATTARAEGPLALSTAKTPST